MALLQLQQAARLAFELSEDPKKSWDDSGGGGGDLDSAREPVTGTELFNLTAPGCKGQLLFGYVVVYVNVI